MPIIDAKDNAAANESNGGKTTGVHRHVLADGTVVIHEHFHGDSNEPGHDVNHDHAHSHNHSHTHAHDSRDDHYENADSSHNHSHGHSHTHTKAVLNRMSRAIGHLESVKRMVEDGRDCTEVLIQLSAVTAALQGTGKLILKDHIEHCIVDAVQENDYAAIEQLNKAIDQFVR